MRRARDTSEKEPTCIRWFAPHHNRRLFVQMYGLWRHVQKSWGQKIGCRLDSRNIMPSQRTFCRAAFTGLLAAFALLIPPRLSRKPLTFDANAPLSKWWLFGEDDTKRACEEDKNEKNARWLSAVERRLGAGHDEELRAIQRSQEEEKCVPLDDWVKWRKSSNP
jgi:hypothetical protein